MSTSMSYQPKADEIKALREETSAPMMDCRKALIDAAGDVAKAKELLRERGASQAEKKSERAANEGLVASYIHAGGKIGVLVEVNSETDFVARNPKFAELSRDIAMHIAAMSPLYVDRASVPEDVVERVRKALKVEGALEPKLGTMPSMLRGHAPKFDCGSDRPLEGRFCRQEPVAHGAPRTPMAVSHWRPRCGQ